MEVSGVMSDRVMGDGRCGGLRVELGDFGGEATEGGCNGVEFHLLDCRRRRGVGGLLVDHVVGAEDSEGEVLDGHNQKLVGDEGSDGGWLPERNPPSLPSDGLSTSRQ